jgi:dTDP-4-dehydrorhamnose 3,5-epimerase
MKFHTTPLTGAWLAEPVRHCDDRGFFARTWCRREFIQQGLNADLVQCSVSFNAHKGTLRGMHFQANPHTETKLVRCTQGSIYDVIIDLRPLSPTFKKWFGVELTAQSRRMLYIPEGFAHGFVTLEDNTEVFYQISNYHMPEAARGLRWDDPAIAIRWPMPPVILSERDQSYPNWIREQP